MAVTLPSVYQDGTATVAANGTVVTGQSTLWTKAIIPGDFFGVHRGYSVRILSVDSDTQVTLANPWPGAAQTAAHYEIMLCPDTSRMQETSRQLLQQLSNGNIAAFTGLAGAADTLPYFTGSGTMSLTGLTSTGRDIIDSADVSAAQTALGISDFIKGLLDDANASAALSTLGVSDYAKSLLDDANASAALSTLGVSDFIKTLLDDANQAAARTTLGAQAALGFTPINKAGDSGVGVLSTAGLQTNTGGVFSRVDRANTGTGQVNYGPSFASGFGANITQGPVMRMLMREIVNQSIAATLEVQGYLSSFATFTFDNNGNFAAQGTISGASKAFLIDHPADPFNFNLRHCATEAPEMLVEYRGNARLSDGSATVDVESYFGVRPGTFTGLWADAQVMALQNQEGFTRVKPSAVTGATFTITAEDPACTDEVAWLIMARRNDAYVRWSGCAETDENGKLIIEQEKADA